MQTVRISGSVKIDFETGCETVSLDSDMPVPDNWYQMALKERREIADKYTDDICRAYIERRILGNEVSQ